MALGVHIVLDVCPKSLDGLDTWQIWWSVDQLMAINFHQLGHFCAIDVGMLGQISLQFSLQLLQSWCPLPSLLVEGRLVEPLNLFRFCTLHLPLHTHGCDSQFDQLEGDLVLPHDMDIDPVLTMRKLLLLEITLN